MILKSIESDGFFLNTEIYFMLKEYVLIGTIKGTKPDNSWTKAEIQAFLDLFADHEVTDFGTKKEDLLNSADCLTKYIWYPE